MKIKSKSMRKKSVAILAGVAIAGAVGASAASLGGLGGDDLGADTGAVASCDTDGIDVAYTTSFDATAGEYMVDSIDLSDINALCAAQAFNLTVLMTDFDVTPNTESDQEFTGTIQVGGGAQSVAATGITAESVTGLALSISGATVVIP